MGAEARVIRWGGWAALASIVGIVFTFGLLGSRTTEFPDLYDASSLLAYLAENRTLQTLVWWLLIASFTLWFPAFLAIHAALKGTKLPLLFGTVLAVLGGAFYMLLVALFLGTAGLTDAYGNSATRATAEVTAQGMLALAGVSGCAASGNRSGVSAVASAETGSAAVRLPPAARPESSNPERETGVSPVVHETEARTSRGLWEADAGGTDAVLAELVAAAQAAGSRLVGRNRRGVHL